MSTVGQREMLTQQRFGRRAFHMAQPLPIVKAAFIMGSWDPHMKGSKGYDAIQPTEMPGHRDEAMTFSADLSALLDRLIAAWENEVVEFKQATNDYSTSDVGKYFSALANETNLRGAERAWLVFGVNNKTRTVVGSDYRIEPARLQSLKMQIAEGAEPITFRNIHELPHPDGRVVMFEVPAAPAGMPISWNGHYYARAGESLTSLGLDKLDEIRRQTVAADWSAQIIPHATPEHLDEAALRQARESFAKKHANRFPPDQVMAWPLDTFLDRSRISGDGKLTRAALLLLGKPDSAHLLLPHPAQMTWKLVGSERAYEHFGPPFLLNTSVLYQRIRNIQVRILPDDALLAVEMAKYDRKVVLEALHNCIAHQDYSRNGRIVVTETPDRLTFENEGNFYEGKPDDYVVGNKTPRRYRNPFLAQAMTELIMIDSMGYGIHEMHLIPESGEALLSNAGLRPERVGSGTHNSPRKYRGSGVHEAIDAENQPGVNGHSRLGSGAEAASAGRYYPETTAACWADRRAQAQPSCTAVVAKATASKVDYIRTRAQDDAFYAKLVTDYLETVGTASRKEIDELLWDKLSEALDDEQKRNKINNLITKLRRAGRIKNTGPRKAPQWRIAE